LGRADRRDRIVARVGLADVPDVGVVVEPVPDQPREGGRVVTVEDADVLGHEITSYPAEGNASNAIDTVFTD
jgi:hypothetical protein